MTKYQIKAKLKNYRASLILLDTAKRQLEELETKIEGVSIDYSKPKVIGGKRKDLADVIDRLRAEHEKVSSEWLASSNALLETREIIARLEDPTEKDILTRRYIRCQHWDTISFETFIARSRVFEIHNEALEKLSDGTKLFDCIEKEKYKNRTKTDFLV